MTIQTPTQDAQAQPVAILSLREAIEHALSSTPVEFVTALDSASPLYHERLPFVACDDDGEPDMETIMARFRDANDAAFFALARCAILQMADEIQQLRILTTPVPVAEALPSLQHEVQDEDKAWRHSDEVLAYSPSLLYEGQLQAEPAHLYDDGHWCSSLTGEIIPGVVAWKPNPPLDTSLQVLASGATR